MTEKNIYKCPDCSTAHVNRPETGECEVCGYSSLQETTVEIVATVTEEEKTELLELYNRAQSTPVIQVAPGTKDLSTSAWERVQNFMNELGEKYGYDPQKNMVHPETGDVMSMLETTIAKPVIKGEGKNEHQ